MPIMQLLLFGYGINTVVDHLATIVFDESGDARQPRPDRRLREQRLLRRAGPRPHQDELADAIDAGSAKVALHIPPDFGDQVLRGQTGVVQLVVDGSDPNIASTASFAAGAVAQSQAAQLTAAHGRSGAAWAR